MTKLKLELAQEAGEILTREELKRILGGAAPSGDDPCAGKKSSKKCAKPGTPPDYKDEVLTEWSDTGCAKPATNPCPSGQTYSCAC